MTKWKSDQYIEYSISRHAFSLDPPICPSIHLPSLGASEGVLSPQDGMNQLTVALRGLAITGSKQV